jgi:transcription antitermination factor NusG
MVPLWQCSCSRPLGEGAASVEDHKAVLSSLRAAPRYTKGAKPAHMQRPPALTQDRHMASVQSDRGGPPGFSATKATPAWHVLWTRSNCEQLVFDQLVAQGYHLFLPAIDTWAKGRDGRRHRRRVSLFPGYLFLHHALDRCSDVEVRKARGLVAILGEGWSRRAVVPPEEIEAIRRLVDTAAPAFPYPYPAAGQRVRITAGPLADVEGVLVRTRPTRGLLVLSVELLRRCIAVEIDCTLAIPT